MIGEGKKKLCVTEDKSLLIKEGNIICSRCGVQSDDKSVLCDPVEKFGGNLFRD
jgi:hypothetical protein